MGTHKNIELKPEYTIEQLVKEVINSTETQIVIEVPVGGSTLLSNEINLRLLKFYVEEEEKEIIINTADPVLTSLAQRLGISTVQEKNSLHDQQGPELLESHSRSEAAVAAAPEVESTKLSVKKDYRYGRLLPAIVVLLFTLILALWWFLQPKATVFIYPKEQTLSFKTAAQISTVFNDSDISQGKLPAKNLEKQIKVNSQTITTGHKIIGVIPASGKALVINNSNQPVLLTKGSILYGKDGTRFLTDKDVLVPKKLTKLESGIAVGESYGKAEVSFTAENKGTGGNQPAKSVTKIEEKYQKFLKVVNPAPTHSGADKRVAVVTLDDVKKGEAEVKQQMLLGFSDEARGLVNQDYLYLPDLVKTEVIHIINKPAIGAEADSVDTELEYRLTVLAPNTVSVRKYLNEQFDHHIPANFEAKNRKVALAGMQVVSVDEELAGLELTGQGQIRGILNPNKIKALIKGKSIAAAKEILTRQNEIADVKFKVENQDARLPGFGFQIKLLFPAGSKVNYRL